VTEQTFGPCSVCGAHRRRNGPYYSCDCDPTPRRPRIPLRLSLDCERHLRYWLAGALTALADFVEPPEHQCVQCGHEYSCGPHCCGYNDPRCPKCGGKGSL